MISLRLAACFLLLAAFTPASGLAAEDDPPAETRKSTYDPEQPYEAVRSNPVTYQVDFSVVVTAPHHTEKLKVWLPIPLSDAGQEVSNSELQTFPMQVEPQ